jgi:sec-independent protein translocase protein TatA
MPVRIGLPELLIVLLIVVLIFGVGRVKEIGTAIREFRKALKGENEEEKETKQPDEKNKS